ncbi:MAG: hypothetical protein ABSE46_16290 [Terracidiphilus sp.]
MQTNQDSNTITVVLSALIFLGIEFEFISRLIQLIEVHAQAGYIWPAVVFQSFLIAALVKYLRFWRRLREMPATTKEKGKIAADISASVLFLLLSLFAFSSATVFFSKGN